MYWKEANKTTFKEKKTLLIANMDVYCSDYFLSVTITSSHEKKNCSCNFSSIPSNRIWQSVKPFDLRVGWMTGHLKYTQSLLRVVVKPPYWESSSSLLSSFQFCRGEYSDIPRPIVLYASSSYLKNISIKLSSFHSFHTHSYWARPFWFIPCTHSHSFTR